MTKGAWVSGFCNSGSHEGTRPRSFSGKAMKVCVAWKECSCDCHEKLTKMCELTGNERVPYPNPDYVAPVSGITDFMTTYRNADHAELLPGHRSKGRAVEERPFTDASGAMVEALRVSGKRFEPTARGRGFGQLEDEVRQVCNRYMLGEFDEPCTPKFVASQIDPGKPPSAGAITGIFEKWEQIGFATIAKNPIRFSSLTAVGLVEGLEKLKQRNKMEKRRGGKVARP